MLKIFFREKVFRVQILLCAHSVVVDVFARDEDEAIERAMISAFPWKYIGHLVRETRVTEMGMDVWMTATGQPVLL